MIAVLFCGAYGKTAQSVVFTSNRKKKTQYFFAKRNSGVAQLPFAEGNCATTNFGNFTAKG